MCSVVYVCMSACMSLNVCVCMCEWGFVYVCVHVCNVLYGCACVLCFALGTFDPLIVSLGWPPSSLWSC